MTGTMEVFSPAIRSLDLSPIKFKLVVSHDGPMWSRTKTDEIEFLYRAFLQLNLENPNVVIVPTKEVDEFWHNHILDTRKYAEDCDSIFGRFLHHFPYLGLRGDADEAALGIAFSDTCALFETRFKNSLPKEGLASVCGGECSSGCGGGNNIGAALTSTGQSIDLVARPS